MLATLQRLYPEWGVTAVRLVGEGLENWVYRAETGRYGPLAVRVPRERWYHNDNDQGLDSRALLRQEAALADLMGSHGIPVPAVVAVHFSDEVDFLASTFVEGDGSEPRAEAMGQVAAAIHSVPCSPTPVLVGMNGRSLEEVLAERIIRRAAVVERLAGVNLPMPGRAELRSLLTWPGTRHAVLHMDFRPANLLTRCGEVAAVVDWSNALLGDPALDLARTAEYGLLTGGFLDGYASGEPFAHVPPDVEGLYRLDTAIMLAVVFLSEAPDRQSAGRQVRRILALNADLWR